MTFRWRTIALSHEFSWLQLLIKMAKRSLHILLGISMYGRLASIAIKAEK